MYKRQVQSGEYLEKITLISPYHFPINLKGIQIQSKKELVYKFNNHLVLFPNNKIELVDKQDKKSFLKRVFNNVGKIKNLRLTFGKGKFGIKNKVDKVVSPSIIISSIVFVILLGFLFFFKRKSNA